MNPDIFLLTNIGTLTHSLKRWNSNKSNNLFQQIQHTQFSLANVQEALSTYPRNSPFLEEENILSR